MLNGIRIRMTDRKESVNETLIGRSDIPAAFVQQLLYTVRSSHLTKAANSSVSLFDGEREHDRTFSITAVGPADRLSALPTLTNRAFYGTILW